ncbi:hypothetical protein RP20_CCG021316 [Aedes albopictus]|nr:hypothetical protein RP20_CCG021316 [Aedes albopictus]
MYFAFISVRYMTVDPCDRGQFEIQTRRRQMDLRAGYVYFLLSFSLIGAVVLGLFGAYRCLRVAAIRVPAPEALALPIQFLGDDLAAAAAAAASAAPLNADPNHLPVPVSANR